MTFTQPYCQIECNYMVRGESNIRSIEDVDKPGISIATKNRAAYDLWLKSNLKHASLRGKI